jgi:hypothetical protein
MEDATFGISSFSHEFHSHVCANRRGIGKKNSTSTVHKKGEEGVEGQKTHWEYLVPTRMCSSEEARTTGML